MRPLTGWLLIGVALAFGALTIEQGLSLLEGRADIKTRWLAWATSEAFVFGKGSLAHVYGWYARAPLRMSLHMLLGGLAVGLGSLQFVPWVRQRFPRWHRASGLVVWLATLASMANALGYLVFVPAARGASGVAFHVGLWSLALLTPLLLWQAVVAVWSRDFRSHMIWMALVYAALLTAPMLRVDWVLLAWLRPDIGLEWNNLATGACVLLQTLMLMALWLDRVGDRHLPGRAAPTSAWPRAAVTLACAWSALVIVQEAWLGGTAADPFSAWRQPSDALPAARWLWGAAGLWALWLAPAAWQAGLRGDQPNRALALAVAGVAAGSLLMGLTADHGSIGRFAIGAFWLGYAGVVALALLMACRGGTSSVGRNAWLLILLCALWLPVQVDGVLLMCLQIPGGSFAEAELAALTIGSGGVLVVGVATGFGAAWRWRPDRRRP